MAHVPHEAGKSSFDLIDREAFLKALSLEGVRALADLGCGVGNYSFFLAKNAKEPLVVHGFDLWEEGVRLFNETALAGGFKEAKGFVADLSALAGAKRGFYDLALMGTVLHDLAERGDAEKALSEAARILKKGGTLAVAEFKKVASHPGPPLHIRLSFEECAALAARAGFGQAGVFDLGPHLYLALFTAN